MKKTRWQTLPSTYSKYLFAFTAMATFTGAQAADPVMIGLAEGEWELGDLLFESDFDDPENWAVQVEGVDPGISFANGELELDLPGMGCTAWLKQEFDGPIVIVYDAVFPGEKVDGDAYRLSDLNNFWHMSDPAGVDAAVDGGLFDEAVYNGGFGSYSPLHGYYGSTGGGQNTTTRFRRYPREAPLSTAVPHIYLNDKDGDANYLLTADQTQSVQLVAADGLVQYINDGRVFYEFEDGDVLQLSNPDGSLTTAVAGSTDYPSYDSGYFGFRTVRSHVKYSGLKVYSLNKADGIDRTEVAASSLAELISYLDDDNVSVTMAPGTYRITEQDLRAGSYNNIGVLPDTGTRVFLLVSGSNSIYDFSGVTLEVETAGFGISGLGEFRELQVTGNNNVLKNLTIVDTGENVRPDFRGQSLVIDGQDNLIEGFHISTKGSYPYGYGDSFGKGGGSVISHNKHSCLLLRGESNHVKGCTIIHRSYGHALFMQGASNPTVEDCYIEGETRTTDDMLLEEGTGTVADNVDFMTVWGYRLPPGYTKSTGEGGIRAYNGGQTAIDGVVIERGCINPTILNNTVVNMRTGITLTHASGTRYVEGCTTIGTERGYAIGRGDIVDCYSDVQHGPAFGVDYETDSGINAEITIIPHGDDSRGHYNGDRHVAYISGSNHNLTFRTTATTFEQELEINVGGDIRIISSVGIDDNRTASDLIINNYTGYPLILDEDAINITYESDGPVTDNSVELKESISCSDISAFLPLEAEANCESSGIVIPETGVFDLPEHVTEIENGDWIKYESVHFGRGAVSVEAFASSAGAGGNVEVRLDAIDGTLVSTIAIAPTGAWETYATVAGTLSETIEGTHDVYLVFTGDAGELFYLDNVVFTRAEASSENYSIGGAATQSSNYTATEGLPELAIDGNTNSNWSGGSVTHTNPADEFPWWELDIGETKDIGEIVLYPRTGCCPQRWTFFTVSVLDENRNEVFSKSYTEQISGAQGIITNRAIGRYVRVQMDESVPLSLGELEVYPFQYFDTDGDGSLDADDEDLDGDGVNNDEDAYPYDPELSARSDIDDDGIPDHLEIAGSLVNISTRVYVLDGEKVAIAGFVVEGTDPVTVLVQGVGSELGSDPLLVDDLLSDPKISVHNVDGDLIVENDDWDATDALTIDDVSSKVGSYTLELESGSAALVTTLEPGIYTVIVSSSDETAGIALVEVYNVPAED